MMNIMNTGANALIAMPLTDIIIEKFELNAKHNMIIMFVVASLISYIQNYANTELFLSHWYIFGIILIICVVLLSLYKYNDKIFNNVYGGYACVNLYRPVHIQNFIKYVELFSNMFDMNFALDCGSPQLYIRNLVNTNTEDFTGTRDTLIKLNTPIIDKKIMFNDSNLNITGYVIWNNYTESVYNPDLKNKENISYKYPSIYIKQGNHGITPSSYYKRIMDIYTKATENTIALYFYKTIGKYKKLCLAMYHKKKIEFKTQEKLYIDTFFHKEKNRLWSIIKTIHFNPEHFTKYGQIPRLSVLLYGPPGTGKSSFAYRVAICLERHIVSIDLRLTTRNEAYSLFYDGENCNGANKQVIILDEFDTTVKELSKREKIKHKYRSHRFELMDYFNPKDFINTKLLKETDTKDNDKKEHDIYNMSNNDDNGELVIKDLLELFQGSVPINQGLIFATTNDYDGITEQCPALFRSGRLTPIKIGYIDKETLQNISKHYFNKELTIYLPDQMKIPTSQIIEIALSKVSDNDFNGFQEELYKII